MEWLSNVIDWIVNTIGMYGIWAIVFAESGLFFGFFLPGDSLLITSGILASTGRFPIWTLVTGIVIAAIAGDQVGYWTGKQFGPKVFREQGKYLNTEHLVAAKKFFDRHGPWAIVLARFTPAVRTFTPIVAGAAEMRYSVFVRYNILGALIWGAGLTLLAYFIGSSLPQDQVKKWEWYIIAAVFLISLIPIVREYTLHRRKKRKNQEETSVTTLNQHAEDKPSTSTTQSDTK